eukprot:3835322-Amphidinium_carterae.1
MNILVFSPSGLAPVVYAGLVNNKSFTLRVCSCLHRNGSMGVWQIGEIQLVVYQSPAVEEPKVEA